MVFGVALAIRLGVTAKYIGLAAPPKADANPDQCDYELLAYRLSQGEGYSLADGVPTARRPPATSFCLAPVYFVCGRSFLAGRIWMCLMSALTCLSVFGCGWLLWDKRIGLVAAAWLALFPGHFYYCLHFLSEVPHALFVSVAAAVTIVCLRKSSYAWGALAGLFWAITILTRPQSALVLPLAWLTVVLSRSRRSEHFRQLAVQTLVVVLLCGAWVARNQVVLGKATFATNAGQTFWGAHNDLVASDRRFMGGWVKAADLVDAEHPFVGTEVEEDSTAWKYGIEWVRRNPSRLPALLVMKTVRFFSPFEATENRLVYLAFAAGWMVTAPFVVVGVLVSIRKDPLATLVLLLPLAATFASTLVFYGSVRFRDGTASIYLIFAAVGLLRVFDHAVPRRWRGESRGQGAVASC